MSVSYEVLLYGGRFDGPTGVAVNVSPVPRHVWAFSCKQGRYCGHEHSVCARSRQRAHTWLAVSRAEAPDGAVRYGLVEVIDEPATAKYAVDGADPLAHVARGETVDERELLPA